jgi:intracellular sulfur oxidation DsrE/DsrF family protein
VTAAPEKPDQLADGFRRPANFLYMTDTEGVPRAQVHLAVIVYGPAKSLMHAAAYKGGNRRRQRSVALLEVLDAAGVRVIVCGQALARLKITREQLLPFVKVATSASMARDARRARYATFGQ